MNPRSAVLGILTVIAIAFGPATSASAEVIHTTEDVTGQIFSCANHTYTVTGQIGLVVHSSTDGQARQHLAVIATSTGVTAVDENGSTYRVVSAQPPDTQRRRGHIHLPLQLVGPDHDNSTCRN